MSNLSQTAILVLLNISTAARQVSDKDMKKSVVDDYSITDSSLARVTKDRFTKRSWAPITEAVSQLRIKHYSLTAPAGWGKGPAILPSGLYFTYQEEMASLKNNFYSAVEMFADQIEQHKASARAYLGTAYKEEEYPTPAQFIAGFSVSTVFSPIADHAQYEAVALLDDAAGKLKAEYQRQVDDQMEVALRSYYSKLYEVVDNMRERFTVEMEKPRYHASLVDNISSLVPILRKVNIGNSNALSKLADEAEARLCAHSIEDLRASKKLRAETARAAEELVGQIGVFL